jgi:hypothetical protein
VTSCAVSEDGAAQVRLRLPTYFCAPNFAFLMVADAYDVVSAVDGVSSTQVVLEDHFAGDAINAGVAARTDSPRPSRNRARLACRRRCPAGHRPGLWRGHANQVLPMHLRKARTGVQANTSICRGMLRQRYASAGLAESEMDEQASG